MSILSSKTGILCLISIVVGVIVIGTLTDATTGNVSVKGNYGIITTTGGATLLVAACVSVILHLLTVISSFMGDESSILKMNFFFLNQILIAAMYFGGSVSFFVYTEYARSVLGARDIDVVRTANSFGIIGFVLCAVTAFLAKKGM